MAEFECGYCTGCGRKVGKSHRPYCWRKISMMCDVTLSERAIDRLVEEMYKHWKIREFFLCKPKHVYYNRTPEEQGILHRLSNG